MFCFWGKTPATTIRKTITLNWGKRRCLGGRLLRQWMDKTIKKREISQITGQKKSFCVISVRSRRPEFNTRPAKKECWGWGRRSRSARRRGDHTSGPFERPVTFGDKWNVQWNIKHVFPGRLVQRSKDAEETFLSMLEVEDSENRLHTKGRRVSKDLTYIQWVSVDICEIFAHPSSYPISQL